MQLRNTLFTIVLGASMFACASYGTPRTSYQRAPDPQMTACDAAFDRAERECIEKCSKQGDRIACEAGCPAAAEKTRKECAASGSVSW
jgi:hypothetical protein